MSEIGLVFDGVPLSLEQYERVESAYVLTAEAMLAEASVRSLMVNGLEEHGDIRAPFREGAAVELPDVRHVIRSVLREQYWCRLEAEDAFVHFGYDYYMYVGVRTYPSQAIAQATELGLFVEEFKTPCGVA